ncbi:S-adenosylmethionine:tRNA ribosyltransferase-isomerase [Planctomycetes bacterium Pla163]|uniref:S-adenosylmethionine:tRNA ribosyltransferase-isomerase n=1 Tax=Rohdeia mirabilis TaxID=2528008 RepID=A0A518CWV8_9BACT|nr:S-adenosylmethionine:tRNA ribosyltransferase-isomerase [Planctomycetes bacterium Pla163]
MKLSHFDYELPDELIAQSPAARREDARLLVHRLSSPDRAQHATVADLPQLLEPGDLIVVNDTRVRRARLAARRTSGGRVECLLVERLGDLVAGGAVGSRSLWSALCRPASRLKVGERLVVESGVADTPVAQLVAIEREQRADGGPGPHWTLELLDADGEVPRDDEALVERIGDVPLPPYVERAQGPDDEDARRYQTVYADRLGAVAAPTAGLHLSDALLARLAGRGIERASVTLHVGPGTFRPVDVEDLGDHPMHSERYDVPGATRDAIERTRAAGGRVVAVGTTVVRTLVAARDASGLPRIGSGATDLFIHPAAPERAGLDVVDGLLTNFHLPRSTLLMLVAALVGTERTLALYREAVEQRYRFYSFGDGMLILP